MSFFEKKKFVVGPFMKVSDPALVEIAAFSGFDFVILDLEHGPNSIETIQGHVRAAQAKNIIPVIRVPEINENVISKALDIGADYVQVPQIETAEDARRVVKAAKFYPEGARGVCRYVRAADYVAMPKEQYFGHANKATGVIIHIEGNIAFKNIDEILKVDGVDIIFIGPYDMSQSCGVPGQVDHPKVISQMKEIVDKAASLGKVVGTFVESPESAKQWIDLGVKYIAYAVDVGIYYDACKTIVDKVNA
ncbi:aldolase/citrate lyase family protein [Tamlana sp. 2_MG-2023]|uniref:HpcH/HpaI aldolase family protein n=1 Tax=unclassified Tamlana TaxID=2614803 RepID=UPI0026E19EA2|nr:MULTISPECIES: aldolase/citrate lyase family protein [unclassified Tamlana]MDO6761216.1 aldolase/citrate lyase family protein [Tamlana sp. 2_MG-2023]MDO6791699.1 aldolase/citrate lyase family protein [Tamlana sp. 1_MG-2023]